MNNVVIVSVLLIIFGITNCSKVLDQDKGTVDNYTSCPDTGRWIDICNCRSDSAFKHSWEKGEYSLFSCEINRTDSILSVSFHPIFIKDPSEFQWDFGNGETSWVMYPTVFYRTKGIFDVSVTYVFADKQTIKVTKKGIINFN